ncbi:MAG TPA: hypothetical protein VE715_17925, partial [Blastocatellia bacterium]|nr:hypothetical protein [Blastocatellia bacterium]
TANQLRAVRATPLGNFREITGPASLTASQEDVDAQTADVNRTREQLADQRLRIQEVQVQNQVNRGLLTEAEAQKQLGGARRAARDELIATLEAQRKAVGENTLEGLQITEQIERMKSLGVELSNTERFMRGFGSATDSVGDAFERFGQNVSRALTNTKDLLNGLKNSVLQLFNDLLGQSLQNLVRSALAPLLGLGGGGAGGTAGGIGNIFRTPSTFPAQIAQAFAGGAGGNGVGVPPSTSDTQQIQQVLSEIASPATRPRTVTGGAGTVAGVAGSGFSLGGLFGNLASAAPLLGVGLGAGLGGQSRLGQVFGAAGAGAVGLGVSFGASVFGAGGGLAQAALAALGPVSLIGAPLLVGAILLGKAKQRKADEEASGQFLIQAEQSIEQLATGIATDQIEGAQARALFDSQILATFRQQISGLKTKSVVDSRLKNQVHDLENVYQARITPLIADQSKRRADAARFAAIDRRLIPQFAIGGVTGGGLAILHPNEMVLTPRHQSAIRSVAGGDIFDRVGVPGVQSQPVFDQGGIMPSFSQPPVIVIENITLFHGMSESGADELVAVAMKGRKGERIVAEKLDAMRTRGKKI